MMLTIKGFRQELLNTYEGYDFDTYESMQGTLEDIKESNDIELLKMYHDEVCEKVDRLFWKNLELTLQEELNELNKLEELRKCSV